MDRAKRFDALAAGHGLSAWLGFLGRLTGIQHDMLQKYPAPALPDEEALMLARKHGMPPIPAAFLPRDPAWRGIAAGLAQALLPHAPPPARDTLGKILTFDEVFLESIAGRILRLEIDGPDIDVFPFVAAALQVHWTAMAAALAGTELAPPAAPGICPCCGFPPVAGIVRIDGDVARLRYLHCALCNTEWHLVRVTCAGCGDNNRIAYHLIGGGDEAVRVETCDSCNGYLKIVYREKSPQADPVADDLATLALDLLIAEQPYNRLGPNLLFMCGNENTS
jgi:FdhE protein